jgi:tetratricopeptide (TPR) repeat protein
LALAVTATKADDWSDCKSGAVSTVEAACSAIIEKAEGSPVDLAIAYTRRGDLHRNRGQLEQALADFAAALLLDPDSVEAYLDRGVTYRDQNRLDEAMADLDRAVQLAPKNPDLRIARASIEEIPRGAVANARQDSPRGGWNSLRAAIPAVPPPRDGLRAVAPRWLSDRR